MCDAMTGWLLVKRGRVSSSQIPPGVVEPSSGHLVVGRYYARLAKGDEGQRRANWGGPSGGSWRGPWPWVIDMTIMLKRSPAVIHLQEESRSRRKDRVSSTQRSDAKPSC